MAQTESMRLFFLRRWFGALLALWAWCVPVASAQTLFSVTPVPRHAPFSAMPARLITGTTSQPWKAMTDQKEDALPGSISSYHYSVIAGNTYGAATTATKLDWTTRVCNWVVGKADAGLSAAQRGTAEIESMVKWVDDIIAPEFTMRYEQMADFQRMLKAYQLFRQMEIMAKSWTGSIFKFDVLDIVPVFEQVYIDELGTPSNGIRTGIKYKDKQGGGDLLSSFGLDSPFVGTFNTPLMKYKGPHHFSDIGFDIEASPYQGTVVDSEPLRIGKAGNEILDRVFFEGMLGRNMAGQGLYYTPKAMMDRPSPVLLRQRAQTLAQERQSQIVAEADAYSKRFGVSPVDALNLFTDEMAYWNALPDMIYENQMQRINRLRDEVQPAQNDVVKLESPEKLKEGSDPQRKTFLDNVFNLYTQLGDSTSAIYNAATGEENENDNPGPRLLYKANVAYAKSTHAAYLEAAAIRRYLAAKIMAESQRGSSQAFYNLWRDSIDRNKNLAQAQVRVQQYTTSANRVISGMNKLGITLDAVHAEVKRQ